MHINDGPLQWMGWAQSPCGALRNPVEHASELSRDELEARVLLHYPQSPLVEDGPWGLTFRYCNQANSTKCWKNPQAEEQWVAGIEMGSCSYARNGPSQAQVVLEVGWGKHGEAWTTFVTTHSGLELSTKHLEGKMLCQLNTPFKKCIIFLHFNILIKTLLCPFQFALPLAFLPLKDYCRWISLIQLSLFDSWRVLEEPTEYWWCSLFLQENARPQIVNAHSECFSILSKSQLFFSHPATHIDKPWPVCGSPGRADSFFHRERSTVGVLLSQILPTCKFWESGRIHVMRLSPACQPYGNDTSDLAL